MISFIVPVYNGERFLRACVDSVLNQSERDIEVILINDGSTDGSAHILLEYAQKDARVRVIEQENRGVSAARNRGIEAARGEYLWFFDGDDVLRAGAAEAMLQRARETEADLVLGNYQYYHQVSGELQTPSQRVGNDIWKGNERIQAAHITPLGGCKLWKTELIRKNDIRFWPLRLGEDTAFFLCGLACCRCVATIDRNIYAYRIYEGSSSYTYSLKELEFIEAFDRIDRYYAEKGGLEDFRKELLFDRMFYYVSVLNRLPRHKSKKERRELFDAYIDSRRKLDFSTAADREDIMNLVETFDRRAQKRWIYESECYAVLYRTGRRMKHMIKRMLNTGRKVKL